MFAAALREEAHRELISVEGSSDRWTQCGFLRVSMKSFLWLLLLREIVAENTEEECETVCCTTGIKVPMVPYLNETCMSLSGMSSGPHGQTSAPAHEFSSANMSNEVCHKSCSLHKSFYSALQRDHCVCFDSHSGSPADPALCNVTCPGNSSQFCGGDSWYTFHLMYLWVAPVEAICSGMPELVGNNMPMSTTVCLDYFNEIVPCISTCSSGQRPPTCEPELWLIIGKAAQRGEGGTPTFLMHLPRRRSGARLGDGAKRGGVVACGVVATLVDGGGELPGAVSAGDGHACLPASPLQFEQCMMTLLYRVMVVSWLSVLAAAMPALRLSYSKLEH